MRVVFGNEILARSAMHLREDVREDMRQDNAS
jgi:hypothetical protein